jgi:hypothetical protein
VLEDAWTAGTAARAVPTVYSLSITGDVALPIIANSRCSSNLMCPMMRSIATVLLWLREFSEPIDLHRVGPQVSCLIRIGIRHNPFAANHDRLITSEFPSLAVNHRTMLAANRRFAPTGCAGERHAESNGRRGAKE